MKELPWPTRTSSGKIEPYDCGRRESAVYGWDMRLSFEGARQYVRWVRSGRPILYGQHNCGLYGSRHKPLPGAVGMTFVPKWIVSLAATTVDTEEGTDYV